MLTIFLSVKLVSHCLFINLSVSLTVITSLPWTVCPCCSWIPSKKCFGSYSVHILPKSFFSSIPYVEQVLSSFHIESISCKFDKTSWTFSMHQIKFIDSFKQVCGTELFCGIQYLKQSVLFDLYKAFDILDPFTCSCTCAFPSYISTMTRNPSYINYCRKSSSYTSNRISIICYIIRALRGLQLIRTLSQLCFINEVYNVLFQ